MLMIWKVYTRHNKWYTFSERFVQCQFYLVLRRQGWKPHPGSEHTGMLPGEHPTHFLQGVVGRVCVVGRKTQGSSFLFYGEPTSKGTYVHCCGGAGSDKEKKQFRRCGAG